MKRFARLYVILPAVALALAACGQDASPPTPTLAPTATLAPTPTLTPTPTSVPATATSIAPEATPAGEDTGSNTSSGTTLLSALQNAKTANTYRVEMEMRAKGDLGLVGQAGSSGDFVSLFNLTGEFRGTEAHYTMKGLLRQLLGIDASKGLEAIIAGDKYYMHGPVNMLGATEDKWYVIESSQSQAIQPPIQASDVLSTVAGSDIDLSAFTQSGSETIDGKTCVVFSGDKDATMKAFTALDTGVVAASGGIGQVKNAELSFAMCDDGYPHRMSMMVEASSKDAPDKTFAVAVDMHMYDFNADISITAPSDATPLELPN